MCVCVCTSNIHSLFLPELAEDPEQKFGGTDAHFWGVHIDLKRVETSLFKLAAIFFLLYLTCGFITAYC